MNATQDIPWYRRKVDWRIVFLWLLISGGFAQQATALKSLAAAQKRTEAQLKAADAKLDEMTQGLVFLVTNTPAKR